MEFRDDLLIINVYTLPSVSFKMVDHEQTHVTKVMALKK